MNPEKKNQHKPKPDNNLSTIVADCLNASKPKQARQAEQQLLQRLNLNTDTALEAVLLLQKYWGNTNPALVKKAVTLTDKVLVGSILNPSGIKQSLEITPNTVNICQKLAETDLHLQDKNFVQSILPPTYRRLIGEIIPDIKKIHGEGLNSLILPLTEWEWFDMTMKFLPESINEQTPYQQDNLINLLKTPIRSSFGSRLRLFDKPFAGTSLADIEYMFYPLSQSDVFKINNFFIDICSQESNIWENGILIKLFQQQVYFSNATEGKISYQNKALLANLNNWQEKLVVNLLFKQDELMETQMQKLLQYAPEHFTQFLPLIMALWTCNSPEMDPHFSGQDFWGDYREIVQNHPLSKTAVSAHLSQNPNQALSAPYLDQLGQKHILDNLLPLLEERLTQFRVLEKCQAGISAVRDELNDTTSRRFLFQH